MSIATHHVEVPFPQAFAALQVRSSPFPSAPRYGCTSSRQAERPATVKRECALLRGSTLSLRHGAPAQVRTLVH